LNFGEDPLNYVTDRYGFNTYFAMMHVYGVSIDNLFKVEEIERDKIFHCWIVYIPYVICLDLDVKEGCVHSLKCYLDKYVVVNRVASDSSFLKLVTDFRNYVEQQDNGLVIKHTDLNIPDDLYDLIVKPYFDSMLSYLGEEVYITSKEEYVDHISQEVDVQKNDLGQYLDKRKLYKTAPVIGQIKTFENQIFKGDIKNFLSFITPIIDHPVEYRECKRVYFIGCGSSKWYSRLGELVLDKEIIFIDNSEISVNPGSTNSKYWVGDFRDYPYMSDSYFYFDVFSFEETLLIYEDIRSMIDKIKPLLYSNKLMVKKLIEVGKKDLVIFGTLMMLPFQKQGSYEIRSYGTRYSDSSVYKLKYLFDYCSLYHWTRFFSSSCYDCIFTQRMLSKVVHLPSYYRRLLHSKGVLVNFDFRPDFFRVCRHGNSVARLSYFERDKMDLCCYDRLYSGSFDLSTYYKYCFIKGIVDYDVSEFTPFQKKMLLTWCLSDSVYTEDLLKKLQ